MDDKTSNISVHINARYCCFPDAPPEQLNNDDENFDEIDDGDGEGFLHHLYMLLFSMILSSVLTYYFCIFS